MGILCITADLWGDSERGGLEDDGVVSAARRREKEVGGCIEGGNVRD
jgi:hypothetical protein